MTVICRAALITLLVFPPALAMADDPDTFQQGVDALKKADYDLAIACFIAVLKDTPDSSGAYLHRGYS